MWARDYAHTYEVFHLSVHLWGDVEVLKKDGCRIWTIMAMFKEQITVDNEAQDDVILVIEVAMGLGNTVYHNRGTEQTVVPFAVKDVHNSAQAWFEVMPI